MPAAPSSSQETTMVPSKGRIAAVIARGCMGREKADCTLDFAIGLVKKQHGELSEVELEKAKHVAERVLAEVVSAQDAEDLEAWASKVEGKDAPFDDTPETDAVIASKEELHAAVKELGIGATAFKNLTKDNDGLYCEELQKRVLADINKITGETYTALPNKEKLVEIKKSAEANKELAGLDASNIIEGRPKRRAASNAAAAIKKDVQKDLEREEAQAECMPQTKKQKVEAEDSQGEADSDESDSEGDDGEEGSDSSGGSSDDSEDSDETPENDRD